MNIIKSRATKYILFVAIFTIFIMFNSSKGYANGDSLIPRGSIDAPVYGTAVNGEVVVSGWFLDVNGVSKIEVLVDGKIMGEAQIGISRPDVKNAYPEYQNVNSGYKFTLNTKNLTNGQHRLTIRETGNNGAVNNFESQLNIQNLMTKGSIDVPVPGTEAKGEIAVRGWFLDASGVSKVEVFVDGKSMGEAQYGSARPDVNKVFPEYGIVNSGYQFTLNTKNLTNGQHKLTVKETGNNGATKELESQFNVQKLLARGSIDFPVSGTAVKGEIAIGGWFLDPNDVSKIEVLVDGKNMGEAQYGIARPDVYKVFPEYGNANSGYKLTLNTKNLTNGQHRLIVIETGKNGVTNELESLFNVENLPVKGYIDTPGNTSTIKGEVPVRGWLLDQSGVSKIEVYVDGKIMGQAQYGSSRTDVAKIFPEYQNGNSGFQFTLNTKNLANGQHRLKVRETGNNGAVYELENLINVANLPVRGSIDAPGVNSTIKGEFSVNGWFLDESGVSRIEVLVDGKSIGLAQYGSSRPDVAKAYPEYQNGNPGYQLMLNTKNLTNGQHKLTIRETGNNGVTNELESLFNVGNQPIKGSIDSPLDGSTIKGEITVGGWFLDISDVSSIEVFVDGKSMGTAQYGISRPDVLTAFPEYKNGNSGYQITFNTLLFADGTHTLSVKETGKNGSTFTLTNKIYIYNGNPYLQIDLRKPANITAQDIVNFFNQKRPDSPLKNFAQSFIDAQNKYGVNAQYLVAHAIWETGWGGSNLRNYKYNLFGYGAYDSCPFTCGYYFPTGGDSINFEGYIVRRDYLDPTGIYYNGPTLTGMNIKYATDPNWKNGIANLMQSIKPFDSTYYFQVGNLAGSSVAAPTFGRNIPSGLPYPTEVIINYAIGKTATVTTNGLSFRSIPYTLSSTLIKTISSGTVVQVLGYNTDVRYFPNDSSKYPYDNRWYRVLVNGQEGWLYGGGIRFNN